MGFDFDYAEKATIVNKTNESDPVDFPKAKANSLDRVQRQLKAYVKGDINGKNGKPKPSNWFRQDEEGQWMVHWRISNKPVYFTPALADPKKKGWMVLRPDITVDRAFNDLIDEIKSGKHDAALQEAFDRKPALKKTKAKAEAEE